MQTVFQPYSGGGDLLTKSKLERMERSLSIGKWRFIAFYGVIGWGIGTAVLFSLIQRFSPWGPGGTFLEELRIWIVVFPVAGLFMGMFLWSHLSKRYARASQ